VALVGPTASGKSALALELAERLGDVEIVSVDSMQLYRGLDVGTAKPTAEERARVRHHMLDLAEPTEDWSVAQFQDAARTAVRDIEARGRRALLVGGTGLYVRAVVDNLQFPGEDAAIRARIDRRAEEPDGLAALYAELAQRDPAAAARIEPGNRRRIVRALEVIELTGEPFSASGVGLEHHDPCGAGRVVRPGPPGPAARPEQRRPWRVDEACVVREQRSQVTLRALQVDRRPATGGQQLAA